MQFETIGRFGYFFATIDAFEMISAQFPEPFGTAVNTTKVCFHFYMVSLVAISYYTLDYYPQHRDNPKIVWYIGKCKEILGNFYGGSWFQQLVDSPLFIQARKSADESAKLAKRQTRHNS